MLRAGTFERAVRPLLLAQTQERCRSTVAATLSDIHHITSTSAVPTVEWNEAKPFEQIPGPKPLPVVGNAFLFTKGIGELADTPFVKVGPALHEKYGPVARVTNIPGKPPMVFIKNLDAVQQMYRTEGQWPIRDGGEVLNWYFRNRRKNFTASLMALQGQEWKDFRTAVNQAMMQPRTMKLYVTPMHEVAREFVDRMAYLRDSKNELPRDFNEELAKWALEVMTFVALETRLGVLKKDLSPDSEELKIIENTRKMFDGMEKLEFSVPVWKVYSTKTFREFVTSMDYFTRIAEKHVKAAAQRLVDARKNTSSLSQDQLQSSSVLERILGNSGDIEKAVTMAMDMLLAGGDTTGMAVAVAFYYIAKHPDKQRKLQEELDRVFPDPKKVPTQEDIEQLKYLRACIKESMRLEPVISFNGRTAPDDIVILGYRIPKGTQIFSSNMEMCHEDEVFPRAKEFIPERWLRESENLRTKHAFAFLPFGFGSRMCVGKRFADMAMETLVAQVFRNYNLEWHHPPPQVVHKMIAQYTSPLKFRMIERK